MAWVEILPSYASLFRHRDWESATSFLSWTGILVNRHRNRQVEQVFLPSPDESFFLKKEYAVSWRDRFRNAWQGFGWCSTAVREGAILQALREAGIGCPDVVALGEHDRQAFVLTRDESAMTDLRGILPTFTVEGQFRLADALGRELAKMHDAGFDHPDLFAKHILVAEQGDSFRLCILDWQRARRRRSVSWRLRCRDLAILDTTLHDTLASDRLRLRCLRAYAQSSRMATPPLGRLAQQIRQQAMRLRQNRNIREIGQLPVPVGDHQFVPLQGGRLLVVRSYYEQLDGQLPEWLTNLSMDNAILACASGSGALLLQSYVTSSHCLEIPPLAHTLFRLQRFGVPAPRLLAVGCNDARVFILADLAATVPLCEVFAKASPAMRSRLLRQAGRLIRQIHEAGYYLPVGDAWERRLGVVPSTGQIMLAQVEPLLRDNTPWQEVAPREFNRQRMQLSRTEQLRFLQGYLKHQRDRVRERPTRSSLFTERAGMGKAGGFMIQIDTTIPSCEPSIECDPAAIPTPHVGPGTWWQRLLHGVRRLFARSDWSAFAGENWPDRIMKVNLTDDLNEKQGRSTARWPLETGDRQLVVYLKRHFQLPWRHGLLATLWPAGDWSPAMQEYKNLEWAIGQGLPVPKVVAAGEFVGPWGNLQSFLAIEELTDMLPLHQAIPLAARQLDPAVFRIWKAGLVREIARLARFLHDRNRFHKDFYLCHFFIHRADTSCMPTWSNRVFMIDFHRLAHHPFTRAFWISKDLGQLLYSSEVEGIDARDRLRFWRAYLGPRRHTRLGRWFRSIVLLRGRRYREHNAKAEAKKTVASR